jgi:hypothetical protein
MIASGIYVRDNSRSGTRTIVSWSRNENEGTGTALASGTTYITISDDAGNSEAAPDFSECKEYVEPEELEAVYFEFTPNRIAAIREHKTQIRIRGPPGFDGRGFGGFAIWIERTGSMKVKISAFITNVETRIIELTDDELREFSDGDFRDRIIQAVTDDEGEFVESYTSGIDSDEWEIVE